MAARGRQNVQLPSLLGGPVPLVSIREQARRSLVDLVDQKRGTKALVLDPSISGPLTLLEPNLPELLTEHGVIKLVHLDIKGQDEASLAAHMARLADARNVMYIVRATVENMQAIALQVKSRIAAANKSKQPAPEFSAFLVPRRTIACERVLEEEGILGDVSLGEFALDMVPVEEDVLSLELEGSFFSCVVEGDSTPLFYVARAMCKLQAMYGLIPRLQGKGPAAVAVRDMCIRLRKEGMMGPVHGGLLGSSTTPLISRAVLIDREVDIITPMMTQITFEGLVDEVTGIRNGAVPWVPKDKPQPDTRVGTSAAPAAVGSRGGSTMLNSTDPFYKEFRDLPYHIAIQRLQHYARDARREYTELGSKDLSELKSFVKGLPKLMMLDRLSDIATPVAEQVKEQLFHDKLKHEQDILDGYDTDAQVAFIEELMYRGGSLLEVLRLLVLLNECHQGLSKKHLDPLRQELLHTYGHQHLLTLSNLEVAGFIRPASSSAKASFKEMRKALRLSVPEVEDPQSQQQAGAASGEPPSFKPNDVSFLYKGYAPLSIRLVETALSPLGWSPFAEVMALLPGTHFDIVQTLDANGMPSERPYKAHVQQQLLKQQQEAAGGVQPSSGGASAASTPAPVGASASEPPSTAAGGLQNVQAGEQTRSAVGSDGREVVLVVFIGGVTFSEISALRFLESRPDCNFRFLVLTTRIINGNTMLQTFVDGIAAQIGTSIGMQ